MEEAKIPTNPGKKLKSPFLDFGLEAACRRIGEIRTKLGLTGPNPHEEEE